jgi:hypothetical protein
MMLSDWKVSVYSERSIDLGVSGSRYVSEPVSITMKLVPTSARARRIAIKSRTIFGFFTTLSAMISKGGRIG